MGRNSRPLLLPAPIRKSVARRASGTWRDGRRVGKDGQEGRDPGATIRLWTKRLPAENRQLGIATESRLKWAAVLVGQAVSPANCEIETMAGETACPTSDASQCRGNGKQRPGSWKLKTALLDFAMYPVGGALSESGPFLIRTERYCRHQTTGASPFHGISTASRAAPICCPSVSRATTRTMYTPLLTSNSFLRERPSSRRCATFSSFNRSSIVFCTP